MFALHPQFLEIHQVWEGILYELLHDFRFQIKIVEIKHPETPEHLQVMECIVDMPRVSALVDV
jgi:hypothetical protein